MYSFRMITLALPCNIMCCDVAHAIGVKAYVKSEMQRKEKPDIAEI